MNENIDIAKEGKEEILDVDGVFIFAGYAPNTDYCGDLVETDPNGRIITDHHYATKTKGLYAIGDCSGITHSLSHASASGVYVARKITE